MEKQIEAEMLEIIEKSREEWSHDVTDHTENEYIREGLLNAGYRKQEWISVEERLPECEIGAETEALLFVTSAGKVEAGYFGRGSVWRDVYFRHYRNSVGWDVSDVTHWMPLPEPPKGE